MHECAEETVRRPIAVACGALALIAGACSRTAPTVAAVDTAPVTTRDIIVNVEASGVIEPVDAVQVKSKASGQIVKMPVVVGSHVKEGDLLAQVDPRQMQSAYDADVAALKAAQDNLKAQKIQISREDSLFAQRVITAQEHESADVSYSNAQSAVAAAKNNQQVAQINLADATVRAPLTGTVIDKAVSLGQVIASATNVVGGGTTLVTIADLGKVLDSALVNESDIGQIKEGQQVTVSVSAYPNRPFQGTVSRISPEAIIQQSVTMFPVLVSLDNSEGLLLPGMNSDATIGVTQLLGVLAVPNDAIASAQEELALAPVLEVPKSTTDSVYSVVLGGGGGGGRGARSSSDSTGARGRGRGGRGGRGRTQTGGEVALGGATSLGASAGGGGGGGGTQATHRGVVFVQDTATKSFVPRMVVLGGGNYDMTSVVSGLRPGERVALLSDVRVQASRDSTLQRIQGRSGIGAMPGGGARGGGGGGGGGRGGGRGG
jgi:HlyD family secretion protein